MLAVYDLALSPPTFDFVGFLVAAERYRLRKGAKALTIAIVSGPNGGFRQDDLPPNDPAVRRKMLDNVVKPMCRLLPSCKEVVELTRDEALARLARETIVFPAGYKAEQPKSNYGTVHIVRAARANVLPFVVDGVTPDPDLVTITLRQSTYWPSRNSNTEEWIKVAQVLRARGRRVVFVPDAESDGAELEGFEIDRLASTDLIHRARLAASASLNLAINNGPVWMLALMPQVTSMLFKMVSPDAPAVSPLFFKTHELPVGTQMGRANHRIVWDDDNADIILAAIDEGFEGSSQSAA